MIRFVAPALADLAGTPYNVYVLAVVLYLAGLAAVFYPLAIRLLRRRLLI